MVKCLKFKIKNRLKKENTKILQKFLAFIKRIMHSFSGSRALRLP